MSYVTKQEQENQEIDSQEIILQQIENLITKEGGGAGSQESGVKYRKLFCLASKAEIALMWVGWFFAFLAGVGMPAWVFLIGDILEGFNPTSTTEQMMDKIRYTSKANVFIGLFVMITTYAYYSSLLIFSERIANKTRIRYLQAILQQESAWYDLTSPEELSSRLRKEVLVIQQALGEKMGTIIVAIGMSLAGFATASIKGWSFSLVVLTAFPFIVIPTRLLTTIQQSGFAIGMKAYGQSAGYAEQALDAIRVVAAFGQEETELRNYEAFLVNAKKSGVLLSFKSSIILALFMFVTMACYSYSFFMGSIWIYNSIYNDAQDRVYIAGDILSCFFGIIFGLSSIGMAGPNIKSVAQGTIAGKMVYDIIDRVPTIMVDDPESPAMEVRGKIQLKNVSFVYPSMPDQLVLDDVNVEFEIGKTTAIVGPSGSGKSTIVQLLERFYDPRDGQVLIDGNDLRSFNLKNYRQQIGYVGQEPILFNTTIKENLRFGRPDATDDDIIEALKNANAYDFVMNHDEGIDLKVGQSGGQLSGGQKQRIAIARAFIKKPKVLIFDEATSALDSKNEREVQKAIDTIKRQLGQVTTVVIAHRLSTIQNADTILVLKKGRIIEQGDHHTLLAQHPFGTYAKLVSQWETNEEPKRKNSFQNPEQKSLESVEVKAEEGRDRHDVSRYQFTSARKYDDDDGFLNLKTEDLYGPDQYLSPDQYLQVPGKRNTQKKKEQYLDIAITKKATPKIETTPDGLEDEQKMKELIDMKDTEEETQETEAFKKIEKTNFVKRLLPYSKPRGNVIVGLSVSILSGCVWPVFATLWTKCLFALMNPDPEQMRENARGWCLYMLIPAFTSFVCIFTVRFAFGSVGETITLNIRKKMYEAVLQKAVGWFDDEENAPSVLTAILANDASCLQGASTEGVGIMIESIFGLLCGMLISLTASWKVCLLAIGCFPLAVFGSWAQAQFMAGFSKHEEDSFKDADLLSGDSIINQRTVTSLGHDELVLEQFREYLQGPHKATKKKAHFIGVIFGVSQGMVYEIFAILFWASAKFIEKSIEDANGEQPDMTGEDIFMAIFALMFGAFAAGQANQHGPDVGKAKKAALKIFGYIDRPSKINAVDIQEDAVEVSEKIRGEIEFRNVWFRYPSRKSEWVFKGLNLKINPNESVAVVGESGCGKSTLASLILRFYDPCEGEILIDGVNIKNYNLRQLRARMGMVMQEPTLFNYTIKENILYGKSDALDSEVRSAAEIANALEFIESQVLSNTVEDTPEALMEALNAKKDEFLEMITEEEFNEKIEDLKFIQQKQAKEGKFISVKGLTDRRDENAKDIELHQRFDIDCGLRGGKLSGGQKQRIAIARAVIRQPQILILDEATSALDEDSQKKVQIALENIMENRTSIVIAHRLTTVEKCKRVVMLENGRVVEEGSLKAMKNMSDGHFMKLQHNMQKQEKKERKASTVQGRKESRMSSSRKGSAIKERRESVFGNQRRGSFMDPNRRKSMRGDRRGSISGANSRDIMVVGQPRKGSNFGGRKGSIIGLPNFRGDQV